jgi:hypothetical protein
MVGFKTTADLKAVEEIKDVTVSTTRRWNPDRSDLVYDR